MTTSQNGTPEKDHVDGASKVMILRPRRMTRLTITRFSSFRVAVKVSPKIG